MSENQEITLTLDPFGGEIPTVEEPVPEQKELAVFQELQLSEQEQDTVKQFAEKIDISNSTQVLQFGAAVQKKIADFSGTALENVRTKDLGEVGAMLSNVVTELKSFDVEEEEKGLFGIFKKGSNKVTALKAKYDKAETNVGRICEVLEGHQIQLLKDVAMLDKLYDMNLDYFKEVTMYLAAGKYKLAQVREHDLAELVKKSEQSGRPEDAQAANDLSSMCNRFEKKLYDLDLTRMISIQMAPQIRMVQNNDTQMSEKIQSTLVNTIPLWKSQMVLALGLAHSEQAAKAHREVTDMTNELLKKNAEILKTSTIATARESERGIVDMETLKQTNESLISTLDEVMQIQTEGQQKRRAAEAELGKMEEQLKQKLLEVSRGKSGN